MTNLHEVLQTVCIFGASNKQSLICLKCFFKKFANCLQNSFTLHHEFESEDFWVQNFELMWANALLFPLKHCNTSFFLLTFQCQEMLNFPVSISADANFVFVTFTTKCEADTSKGSHNSRKHMTCHLLQRDACRMFCKVTL